LNHKFEEESGSIHINQPDPMYISFRFGPAWTGEAHEPKKKTNNRAHIEVDINGKDMLYTHIPRKF
jgi:hypothetical protein